MCVLTLNQNISDSTDSRDKTVLHFTVGHGLHKYKYIQIWWLNIVFSHILLFISKVILVSSLSDWKSGCKQALSGEKSTGYLKNLAPRHRQKDAHFWS